MRLARSHFYLSCYSSFVISDFVCCSSSTGCNG